jgi:hypothetical protein
VRKTFFPSKNTPSVPGRQYTHGKRLLPVMMLGVGLVALSWSGRAAAFDAEVDASTAAQAYSLRSPFGSPVLYRQRVMQTLGLGVYNLLPEEKPGGPQMFVKLRMRLDVDFGLDSSETSFQRGDPNSRFVPGLQAQPPIDLMYGYVEGRRLFGGYFDFRLGRQYIVDSLGWWSFDGGLLRLNVPYVKLELYGGMEQRGGLPLSTQRFERDGVWRGNRQDLDGSVFRMFQSAKTAPAYGFAIESAGPYWLHGRFDYRKVFNRGTVVTNPFPDAAGQYATMSETRTSSERLGYAFDATWAQVGGAKAGVVYDLYNALFGSYYGSLDAYVTKDITLSAEYDYYFPTFDGDSIWNWFSHSPITTATGRAGWQITDRLDVAGTGGVRWWETDEDPGKVAVSTVASDPTASSPSKLMDVLGSLYGRYRWQTGQAGLRGVFETGDRGQRKGVDISGEKRFLGGKYSVMARGSIFDWDDNLRPERSATSVGYVLGGGWAPSSVANMMIQWEHNANQLVGQRYRVLALLNLKVGK